MCKVGRGQSHLIWAQGYAQDSAVSSELRAQLLLHHALIAIGPQRLVHLSLPARHRVCMYTDASCEPAPGREFPLVRISYVIMADEYKAAGCATLPDEMLRGFETRKTFIAHGEAFAVYWALWCERRHLVGSSCIWFIDNLGVVSCLCKGSSTSVDVGAITHGILLAVAGANALIWWGHVESGSNISDAGSRGSTDIADALGIPLQDKSLPAWPQNCKTALPEFWLQLLSSELPLEG